MNYLLAYPRSASTFIRYSIEKILKKKTLDCGGRHDKIYGINTINQPILRKEHFIKGVNKNDVDKLILVLRNYKDVYISHNVRHLPLSETNEIYEKLYNSESYFFQEYYDLIKFYDNYNKDKLLVYYEDIKNNSYVEIKKIIDFISDNDIEIDTMLMEELTNNSTINYKKNAQGLRTEKIKKLYTVLNEQQNKNIDEKFKEYNNKLYDKYLLRYEYKK